MVIKIVKFIFGNIAHGFRSVLQNQKTLVEQKQHGFIDFHFEKIFAITICLLSLGWCVYPDSGSRVAAKINNQLTIIVTIRKGWTSDSYRSLRISNGTETIFSAFMGDTGWWRGTNLYLHNSGTYILHDGQGGCIQFITSPLKILSNKDRLDCYELEKTLEVDFQQQVRPLGSKIPPVAIYLKDSIYLGHFNTDLRQKCKSQKIERAKIRYCDFNEYLEPKLPSVRI